MTSEWRNVVLSDIIDLFGGSTPKRSTPEYWNGSIPWLSVKDFNHDLRHVEKSEQCITELGLTNSNTTLLPKGYLIVSARGTVGAISQLAKPMAFNQSCYGIGAKSEYVTNDFLYYLIRYSINKLKRMAHGAVFDTVTRETFQQINVKLPPLPQQRTIAHVLGTLDDKIELNRRMNETLEAMARALFKSWFVDFDPVRAKMQGRDPSLPQHLADLFSGRLVDSELGEIPEGWEVSEIGKEVDTVGGATPSTKEAAYWDEGKHHWATPKDLSKLSSPVLLKTDRKITEAGVEKISSGLLPIGTVLLSSRAPIGYLAIAEVLTAVNQGFIAMICKKRLPNVYVLFWCYENLDYIKDISGGSTFAEISKKVFRPVPVTVPAKEILAAFEDLVRPLYDRIVTNSKESASLAQTRNLLLPKLISGDLRLKNAENLLNRVL